MRTGRYFLAAVFFFVLTNLNLSAQTVLRVALSENKAPYTIASPPGGIEYDLVTQIVRGMGMTPEILFLPNARAQSLLKSGEIDAAISNTGSGLSLPFIAYENVAVSLRTRGISLASIAELAGHSVEGFQNAHLFLGPEFAQMAEANPAYHETSPQINLNRLLYAGRVDVIITDWNIFHTLNAQVEGLDTKQPVSIHRLFSRTRYGLSFRNEAYREAFDASLRKVIATDPFPALAKKYLPQVSEITFRP